MEQTVNNTNFIEKSCEVYTILIIGHVNNNYQEAKNIFNQIVKEKKSVIDIVLYTVMIDLYFRTNELEKINEIYEELKVSDSVTLNFISYCVLVRGYLKLHKFDLVEKLIEKNLQLDALLYSQVINWIFTK